MQATLNLLSPAKKADLRSGFIFSYAQTVLVILFIVAAFMAGTLVAVRIMINGTYDDLTHRTAQGASEAKAITDQFRTMNAYLGRIDSLESRYVPWSHVIQAAAKAAPEGTLLSGITVQNNHVTVSGIALTRDDVLTLQDHLEHLPLFKNVRSPLSNILQKENVKFDFEMDYVTGPAGAPPPPRK